MPAEIPESHAHLIGAPHLAHLATTNQDGSPQVSPIWLTRDDNGIVFSTTEERRKGKNMRRVPTIALSIVDPDNPMIYMEMRGPVRIEPDPEEALPRKLWAEYVGEGEFPFLGGGETRIVCHFTPEHIVAIAP